MTAPPSRVRLADIAQEVGCSVSVVSRVLHGRSPVGPELTSRVKDAARRLGYDRRLETRGRRKDDVSRAIDLVLPQWGDSWANRIVEGARSAAFARGFDLHLTAEREEPDVDWPQRAVRHQSAGVVTAMIRPTTDQVELLRTAHIPLVLIDPPTDPQADVPIISTADREGGYAAGRHLGELGRSRAIALAGVPRFRWGRARLEGVREGIADTNPQSSFEIVEVHWGEPHGVARALKSVLLAHDEPAVIFANTDEWAFQVYALAAEIGLSIPGDLAVMGFDNDPTTRYLRPPLTTMHQPLATITELAIELAVTGEHPSTPAQRSRLEIPSEIVVRGSTARQTTDSPTPMRSRSR